MYRFMIFVLMLLIVSPFSALAYPGKSVVHVTGRIFAGAGHATRVVFNSTLGGAVIVNRGGSASSSLRIVYNVRGGTNSAYEGGVIEAVNHDFIMVPEFDRPVMMVQMRSASGWTQSWNRPRMTAFRKLEVTGMRFHPNIQWSSEVLTIVVTYCDARGVPDGDPQVYEYTINKGFRP